MANEELLNEDEVYIIELTDENGNDVEFELVESLDYEGKEYLVLLPNEEGADELVILEVVPEGNDQESYKTVDDEETLNAVYGIFKDHYKDILTFEE